MASTGRARICENGSCHKIWWYLVDHSPDGFFLKVGSSACLNPSQYQELPVQMCVCYFLARLHQLHKHSQSCHFIDLEHGLDPIEHVNHGTLGKGGLQEIHVHKSATQNFALHVFPCYGYLLQQSHRIFNESKADLLVFQPGCRTSLTEPASIFEELAGEPSRSQWAKY